VKARRASLALAALAAACTSPARAPEPRARLAVEVLAGFPAAPAPAPARPSRVELLLDLTASMRAEVAPGVTRALLARRAAERFAGALAGEVEVGARVLGARSGSCRAVERRVTPRAGESRAGWLQSLAAREPAGEGSLAGALDALGAELPAAAASRDLRVAVFSDLAGECGGDLCAALARLVGNGVRVDLVAVGGASLPDCARDLDAPGPPGLAAAAGSDPAPRFRVERAAGAGPARLLAAARADGVARSLPSGPGTVLIDLDPPARIGPLVLPPSRLTLLRILDFPGLDPPVREWSLETLPLPAGPTPGSEAAGR